MSILLLDHADEKPDSNFRLMRLCEWAGTKLSEHQHHTLHPGQVWQAELNSPTTVLAMGPKATAAAGLHGALDSIRGYVWPKDGRHVIPTVSPGFIQRGNAKWSAAFINDLQKALQLGRDGLPPQFTQYVLDPSPMGALEWARQYTSELAVDSGLRLAFDIETPGKGEDEEDADTDNDAPDRTWRIDRIGFSYRPNEALSVPWAPEYMAAIRTILASSGDKIVWNAGFDVPRIKRMGVPIGGLTHDGMVAWHILHSDLKKSLKFVATFTCPWQPAWKHLSSARPSFYNATDADVELRSFIEIQRGLLNAGLWDVYVRDVVELEPVLVHMQQSGMPVDAEIRLDRARKLADKLSTTKQQLEVLVPTEARKIAHVYKKPPADTTGCTIRNAIRLVNVCPECGIDKPGKVHFKLYKKKHNPCGGRVPIAVEKQVAEYYRFGTFSPSRDQLTRYHNHLKRPLPTVYDKKSRTRKVSFGEEQIKQLMLRYPNDQLYPLVLEYRGLDKLAGTYVGRVDE